MLASPVCLSVECIATSTHRMKPDESITDVTPTHCSRLRLRPSGISTASLPPMNPAFSIHVRQLICHRSQRWLLAKAHQGKPGNGKYGEAFDSLCRLRHSNLQAARDLFLMHHLLKREGEIKRRHNRFVDLWSVGRNRRALIASLITMFFQQFCGVNVLAYVRVSCPVFGISRPKLFSEVPGAWLISAYGRYSTLPRYSIRPALM